MEVEVVREVIEKELVRRGWARLTEAGQIEIASGHLLAHLNGLLGETNAQGFLLELALKTLLLFYEFRESELDPIDMADDRLMLAYDSFVLDERRVVSDYFRGQGLARLYAALNGAQEEQ